MVTAITWGAPPKFARLPIRCLRAAVGDVSVKVPSPPPARHHLCVIQDWSVPSTQPEPDFCAAGGLMPRGEQAECLIHLSELWQWHWRGVLQTEPINTGFRPSALTVSTNKSSAPKRRSLDFLLLCLLVAMLAPVQTGASREWGVWGCLLDCKFHG